ncbi:MAG: Clp protease N-terminal domain-containing protein [Pirellulales bacterium]
MVLADLVFLYSVGFTMDGQIYKQLTEHARKIIENSYELASLARHERVYAAHLLRAMLTDSRGNIAMAALTALASELDTRAGSRIAQGDAMGERDGQINIDALVQHATLQAGAIGHSYAGPEHLLLALLEDPFWPDVAAYFRVPNLTRVRLRAEIFAILGRDDPACSA